MIEGKTSGIQTAAIEMREYPLGDWRILAIAVKAAEEVAVIQNRISIFLSEQQQHHEHCAALEPTTDAAQLLNNITLTGE